MMKGDALPASFAGVTLQENLTHSLLASQPWLFGTQGEWKASPFYKPAKPRRRLWTLHDEDIVARLYPTSIPTRDLADQLYRSIGALRAKARQLGVRRPVRSKASDDAALSPPPPRIFRLTCQPYFSA